MLSEWQSVFIILNKHPYLISKETSVNSKFVICGLKYVKMEKINR